MLLHLVSLRLQVRFYMANLFRKASSPFGGGDRIWISSSNAAVVASAEFFGEAAPPTTVIGYIKYWTGSTFSIKPVKYWNGTSWIQKPLTYWNGTSWLATEYSL